MKARLKDDDPALVPEVLQARLKQREKLARRRERAMTGQAPLVGGRPPKEIVKPDTLQRRKRKAESEATLSLTDVGLPDFAVGIMAADRVAEEKAAAEHEVAERVAAEQAAAKQAVAEAKAEAAIKQAAAELAAAEIEAAIEQAAAQLAAEKVVAKMMAAVMAACVKAANKRERKAAKERRVAKGLAATAGGVAFRVELPAVAPAHGDEPTCFMCCADEPDSYMPCCKKLVHHACINQWHGMGRDTTGKHVLKGPTKNGWKTVTMQRLHQCPWCGKEMKSARVIRIV